MMRHTHHRELHPAIFVSTPLLQVGITLALTAIGTWVGRDGARLLNIEFSDISAQKCLEVSAASTAITTGAMSLCLVIFSLLFGPNGQAARYKEAVNNNLYIAGAAAPQAFLSPFLGAYLLYGMSLQEAAFIGTVTTLGTAPLVTGLFLVFAFAHHAQKCWGDHNIPIEKPTLCTRETQTDVNTTRKETCVVEVVEIARRESSDEITECANPLTSLKARQPRRTCFMNEKCGHLRKRSAGSSTELEAATHHRRHSSSDTQPFQPSP